MTTGHSAVALRGGELEARLAGGSLLGLTSLRHRGAELLVEPEALPEEFRVHRRRAGMTLMHPWANRLGADRFPVADADVVVAADDPAVTRDAAGLPIHGLAPAGAWSVFPGGPASAVVVRRCPPLSAFPFAHEVTVRVDLRRGARLDVHTSVVATGADPVPVAFGWHPYLRLPGAPRNAWQLSLPRRRHVGLDERGLPSGTVNEQEAERGPLGDRTFDDGFEALDDGAVLAVAGGGREVRVRMIAGYPAAQVFAPAAPDVVSLEPMTAPTDALRSGRGLRCARPNAPYEAHFAVEVAQVG